MCADRHDPRNAFLRIADAAVNRVHAGSIARVPRVLLLFEPPDGGVPEHVANLALGLKELNWEVEVAGPTSATTYPRIESAGIRVHRIPPIRRGFRAPWRDLAATLQVKRLVERGGFHLVHGHAAKAGVYARIAARAQNVPAVYTPHGFGFAGDVSAARKLLVPVAERALGRWTDALICVCDFERNEAARRKIGSPPARYRVYNGCRACEGIAVFDPGMDVSTLVGAVAVLRPEKGIDVLLAAAPLILEAVPDAGVLIVGSGDLDTQLRNQAEALGLDDHPRFRFLPFEPPSARYVRALDVAVLPSRWDAFPVAAIEALACGTPQVASGVGGIPEAVLDETGIIVPPEQPEALAEAVIELLRDPVRRERMSVAAKAEHAERFTLARMAEETQKVYREALANARPSVSANRSAESYVG